MSESADIRHPKQQLISSDQIWRQLDAVLWDMTQTPWVVLQTVSREKLQSVLDEPACRKKLDELIQIRRDAAETPAWFQQTHPNSQLKCVAYFSMEFMRSEALLIYSAGLANVVGDQLKAASDLGVPVIGIGLLYQLGYFRQLIDKEGVQQALYPLSALHFGEPKQETVDEQHVFEVQVYLNGLGPETVRVELYANGVDGSSAVRVVMQCVRQLMGAIKWLCPSRRGAGNSTGNRLHGSIHPATRGRSRATGRCTYPVAALTPG